MSDELKEIIHPCLQRGAYYTHSENILIAMLVDSRPHIRELAARRILKIRMNPVKINELHVFQTPALNFNAQSYDEMIDWNCCERFERPVTKHYSNEFFSELMKNPMEQIIYIPELHCHSQAVERGVKIVMGAAKIVCGEDRRDGVIRTKFGSFAHLKNFDTKKDYYL